MIVHNKGEYIRHIGVQLIPGANNLEEKAEKAFNKALENPLNKALVDSGEITVKTKEKEGIATMSATEAIELVKDTYSLDLLDAFLEEEEEQPKTRTTVVKAIREQADALLNPSEDDIVDPNN